MPSTDDDLTETRHGTGAKKDTRVGSRDGTERVKEPVPVVEVDP